MEPLNQKTESIEEVKEKIRRKNRENKEKNKQSDKRLKAIIIITILITIIVIAVVLIKNIPNAANTIEDEIYYATNVGIDINSDGVTHRDRFIAYKPVIYLYPEKETTVNVKLDINGELLYTYPEYNNTWKVKAKPNGTLINTADNKEYNYLFWEANLNTEYDLSKGFVVKG